MHPNISTPVTFFEFSSTHGLLCNAKFPSEALAEPERKPGLIPAFLPESVCTASCRVERTQMSWGTQQAHLQQHFVQIAPVFKSKPSNQRATTVFMDVDLYKIRRTKTERQTNKKEK